MPDRSFHFHDYVNAQEAYHIARKELEPRWPNALHNHDYFELFLIEQGSARHKINFRTETLSRGAMVFIRPTDTHGFCASKEEGCRIINVMFHASSAAHLFERYGQELGPRFFWSDAPHPDTYLLTGPRLERAINSMTELQISRRSLSRIEQFLLFMMTRVIDHGETLPEGTPAWLVTACQAARMPEIFRKGSAGFVGVAGRGHEHVCRMSRKYLGMSPTQYINRIRMEHAAMQLGSSDLPVTDISLDCGIENLAHFYKLFRGVYGNTPKQYRENHRANPIQTE